MLDLLLFAAAEEGSKPAAPGGGGVMPFEPMLLMLAVFALLYFIVLRPGQKRQERERLQLLNAMKKNDRVLTSAGIYGTIVSVDDKEDIVTVKVDDNTRLKMLKSSILRNLSADEAQKAEADKAKETK